MTILKKSVSASGLDNVLSGAGPYTVFAPNDLAFEKLEKGVLDNLLKPENKARLQAVLTYHVVAGEVMAKDVVKLHTARTVNGQQVSVKVSGGSVRVDNAKVVKTDILCSNGVIHVIDTVVILSQNMQHPTVGKPTSLRSFGLSKPPREKGD